MKYLLLLIVVLSSQPAEIDQVMEPIQLPLKFHDSGFHFDLDDWDYTGVAYPKEEYSLSFGFLNDKPYPLHILNFTTKGDNLEVVKTIDHWFNASEFILPAWEDYWFEIMIRFYAHAYYRSQEEAGGNFANARLLLNLTIEKTYVTLWQFFVPFAVRHTLPCGGVEEPEPTIPNISEILYMRDFQIAILLLGVCTPLLWWALREDKREREK